MTTQIHLSRVLLILFFIGFSMILNGQNDTLKLSFVTIKTNPSSKIFLDDQYKNTGKWYGEIQPGQHTVRIEKEGYLSVEQSFSILNGQNVVVEVPEPTEKIITTPNKKDYKQYKFITLNTSLSIQPQFAVGFTAGYVKKFGGFISIMTGFGFKGFSAETTSDDNGFVNGDYPMYTGKTSKSRLSIIVGGIMSVTDKVYVRAGVGYGTRKVAYETVDGKWINYGKESYSGIDLSAGAQTFIKRFTLSFDLVTTSFKAMECKLGFGFTLK